MRYQLERQEKDYSRVGQVMMILLVLFGLLAGSLWWRSNLRSVWADDSYYLMAVMEDEAIKITGVNKNEERGVVLVIPGNVMIPVVGMQGSLKASSLWQFGEDEGKVEEVVRNSLERLLGVKLNGVVRSKGNNLGWGDVLSRGSGELVDQIRWIRVLKKLRSDQVISQGLPSGLTASKSNPDGEEVVEVDEGRLIDWVRDLWSNSALLDEGIGVEVVNASGEQGIGRLAEEMIKAGGGLVVSIGSGEKESGNCWYIRAEQMKVCKTTEWVKEQLGCEEREGEVKSGIRLWIGEEWGERYRRG